VFVRPYADGAYDRSGYGTPRQERIVTGSACEFVSCPVIALKMCSKIQIAFNIAWSVVDP